MRPLWPILNTVDLDEFDQRRAAVGHITVKALGDLE